MAIATEQTKIYGEVTLLAPDQLLQFAKHCIEKFYVRGSVQSISEQTLEKLQDQLVFPGINGNAPTVRVTNPLTWFEYQGERYWLSGNTRTVVLTRMLNTAKFQNYVFEPVPVQQLLIPEGSNDTAIYELLFRLQVVDNDTTNPHTVPQLSRQAADLYQVIYKDALASGKNERAAGGEATRMVAAALGKSPAYVGQLLNIATLPEWLQQKVEDGVTTADIARNIGIIAEAEKIAPEAVFQGLEAVAVGSDKITNKHLKQYREALAKASTDDASNSEDKADSNKASKTAKKIVSTEVATSTIDATLAHIEDLKVDELVEPQLELAAKTVGKMGVVLSTALGSQAIDASKAVQVLPTVRNTLYDMLDTSAIFTIDPNELGETDEERTAIAGQAVKSLRVAGQFIKILLGEGMIPESKAFETLNSLKLSFLKFFDNVELDKSFTPEELSGLYTQFQGMNRTLGLLNNDTSEHDETEESEDDEVPFGEGDLEASENGVTGTVE